MAGDPFAEIEKQLASRLDAYEVETLSSHDFQSEQRYLGNLTRDFALALRGGSAARSRDPHHGSYLLTATVDDLLESAVSIVTLGQNGIFNVGRRELRYMLEAVVKATLCDQQLPWETTLSDRVLFLHDEVPRSSIEVIEHVHLLLIDDTTSFIDHVKSAFGALSGYTHPSQRQLEERYKRIERNEFIGFESAATLRTFNALVCATYDLILALFFEGLGGPSTGDVFIHVLDADSKWRFHRTRFVRQVSHHFDYKAERQHGRI